MEQMEQWKEFLNKQVCVIYDDKPSEFPKHKEGFCLEITATHLVLRRDQKTEAIRLYDIRRIELRAQK